MKRARKLLHEIEDPKEFEAAFYGRFGITPADALKRMPMPEAQKRTVASLMKEVRQRYKLSTIQAGKLLGLSSRTIEDIEQGRRREDDTLTRIALECLIEHTKITIL